MRPIAIPGWVGFMSRRVLAPLLAAISIGAATTLPAQRLTLEVTPSQPTPGALLRLTLIAGSAVDTGASAWDSVVEIRGSMAGEPLHFIAADDRVWRALGAVPVDGEDTIRALVFVHRASGAADTVRRTIAIPPLPKPSVTSSAQLSVSNSFTRPLDAATRERVARENARARAVGSRAHESPPRWTATFLRPRASRVTSRFGTGRAFNGAIASRHLGVDFSGAIGAPIKAANRGIVALVDTFFLAGRVIYIDHGGGVVTGYFHLSKPLVAVGDTVSRGQTIGRVGATGRVTGPHLHWTARYGTLTVNPLDLVALEKGWYAERAVVEPSGDKANSGGSRF